MRYIGNKESIIKQIHSILESNEIKGDSLFDVFAGTTSVGKFYKKLNYQIYSSDLMHYSYVLQKAYIENNDIPVFKNLMPSLKNTNTNVSNLDNVIAFLNTIPNLPNIKDGFIYSNYTKNGTFYDKYQRMYFSEANALRIDTIRHQIELFKFFEQITDNEYYILLASLIESASVYANTTGQFSSFLKTLQPNALKVFVLKPIEILLNDKSNKCFMGDSIQCDVIADIYYLDPPYNERQYAPNYHILETISLCDNPVIKGKTGMRKYDNQKSAFCNAKNGIIELNKIAKNGQYKYLILSYNNEGIMPSNEIKSTLEQYGELNIIEFEYKRYKSNDNGINKNSVNEQLYILKK